MLYLKVDFDKTKHLAESTIKKRAQEREKLIEQERERLATLRQQLELIVAKFRNGQTGSVELFVDLPRNAIRDRMTMGAAV